MDARSLASPGPDTYVSIGARVLLKGVWSVPVTIGNASQYLNLPYVTAKLRVSRSHQLLCEAVSPALTVWAGESLRHCEIDAVKLAKAYSTKKED
jgi:hypothetical protein